MTTKTPQDHKAKATAKRTIEVQGLTLTIDEAALDDFELLDDLRTLESGTSQAALVMPSVLRSFLGADQFRTVMTHLRDGKTGRVGIEAGAMFVGDMLEALNPNS